MSERSSKRSNDLGMEVLNLIVSTLSPVTVIELVMSGVVARERREITAMTLDSRNIESIKERREFMRHLTTSRKIPLEELEAQYKGIVALMRKHDFGSNGQ